MTAEAPAVDYPDSYAKAIRYSARYLPEHRAFHTVLVENPTDRTPALVYADWLDDNGEPEVAHIIRHQAQFFPFQRSYFPPQKRGISGTAASHDGLGRFVVDARFVGRGDGKLLYGVAIHHAHPTEINRYLSWYTSGMGAKETKKLVEALVDRGHVPGDVPARWRQRLAARFISRLRSKEA